MDELSDLLLSLLVGFCAFLHGFLDTLLVIIVGLVHFRQIHPHFGNHCLLFFTALLIHVHLFVFCHEKFESVVYFLSVVEEHVPPELEVLENIELIGHSLLQPIRHNKYHKLAHLVDNDSAFVFDLLLLMFYFVLQLGVLVLQVL